MYVEGGGVPPVSSYIFTLSPKWSRGKRSIHSIQESKAHAESYLFATIPWVSWGQDQAGTDLLLTFSHSSFTPKTWGPLFTWDSSIDAEKPCKSDPQIYLAGRVLGLSGGATTWGQGTEFFHVLSCISEQLQSFRRRLMAWSSTKTLALATRPNAGKMVSARV